MTDSPKFINGYIRNPWSKEDEKIHIKEFFYLIGKDAGRRCGCHDVVFDRMCLESLLDALYKLETLSPKDALYVREQAPYNGFDLSEQGQRRVDDAYVKTMAEIRLQEM